MRGEAWYRICKEQIDSMGMSIPDINKVDLSLLDPTAAEEIDRDIDRTFPRHLMFLEDGGAGQQSLRRMLQAYAVLDPEVGYCQGMGFIAALLLTYMIEERAFTVFYFALQVHYIIFYYREL